MAETVTLRKRLPWLLGVAALLILVAVFVVRGAGRWLVREDPLVKSDVVVVLSGGMPYRAVEAAGIYRAGYASEVWVSRPAVPDAELKSLGVNFIGEEEYDRQILVHLGVPASAVHIFANTIVDTQQEILETRREMAEAHMTSVIFVTSPEHTRRVMTLWRKLVGEHPAATVRAAREDTFDAAHWWRNTTDALAVVREYLGLLNAWAGLPVHPQSR
jgi:uncharacterized SAM-binding protein YcdF (DUF218 family)